MLLLVALACLQDPGPEETYRKLEESISKAKTVVVRFSVRGTGAKEGPDQDLQAAGTMTLKGGKVRLELSMTSRGKERKTVLINDGTKVSLREDDGEPRVATAARGIEGNTPLLLPRIGALMSALLPQGPGAPEGAASFDVSEWKPGADDGSGRSLHFTATHRLKDKAVGAYDTRLWLDPAGAKPLKRTLTLRKGETVLGTLTETYEKFELDAEVPDALFTVESKPAKKEEK